MYLSHSAVSLNADESSDGTHLGLEGIASDERMQKGVVLGFEEGEFGIVAVDLGVQRLSDPLTIHSVSGSRGKEGR